MTILDMIASVYPNNRPIARALDSIKDNYTILVNDNYELVLDKEDILKVKIPSLEKKDQFEYKDIIDYDYPLLMCMRVAGNISDKRYGEILSQFMELYKRKLEVYFKDSYAVDKLLIKVKNTRNRIDYLSYASIIIAILSGIFMCLVEVTSIGKFIAVILVIGFFAVGVIEQFTKDGQIKKIVDAQLLTIKTEWYKTLILKEYSYICNFTGDSDAR